jgi:hypothetical protein
MSSFDSPDWSDLEEITTPKMPSICNATSIDEFKVSKCSNSQFLVLFLFCMHKIDLFYILLD